MDGRRAAWGVVACLVAGAALGVPAVASAATPKANAPKPKRIKVAVLDIQATGPVDKQAIQGLSAVVASTVSSQPALQVLTSDDIKTMLGFEAKKQLLGCGDSSCLAKIGGALGVGYVIAPQISQVGKTWLVTVVALDVEKDQAVARRTGRTADENALIDVTTRVTQGVLPAILGKRLVKVNPAPEAAVSTGGGRGALAWTLTGVGGVAIVAGGILFGSAMSTSQQFKAGQDVGTKPTVTYAQAQAAETQAKVGVAALLVGAAVVTGSFFVPHPRPAPVFGVRVLPGGAYASVTVPLGF